MGFCVDREFAVGRGLSLAWDFALRGGFVLIEGYCRRGAYRRQGGTSSDGVHWIGGFSKGFGIAR